MKRMVTILFSLLLCTSVLLGQSRIRGKVTDLQTGEPLIGANVLITGTSFGAATDVDGNYEIRNITAGTYELRASYVGYQPITISDVRVSTSLATDINFQLPSEGISVEEIQVIAERPLIQKDNTNAVRTTTSDDIDALPVRGINNILNTAAGVVIESGQIFIRGGRQDEVGFYLEGVSIKNPETGGRAVTISQDAIEEIQVQSGGYTSEFGNANAGIIKQQLKSGTSDLKASFEYITDNVGFQSKDNAYSGKKTLGANWYGYNEMSGILSGPIIDPRFKFFFNFNYQYNRDVNPQPYPGVNLGLIVDTLSKENADSITLNYGAGAIKNNSQDVYSYAGTITMDLKPLLFRFSGTFSDTRQDIIGQAASNNTTALLSSLNPRAGQRDIADGSFSVKMTHVISPEIFYEISGGYFMQNLEDYDRDLGSDYWSYGDSAANANAGWVWERSAKDIKGGNVGPYTTPSVRNIMGFAFNGYGEVPVNYQKRDRSSFSLNAALTAFAGKHHTFKVGGEYQQYTIRRWTVGSQDGFAYQFDADVKAKPGETLEQIKRGILVNAGVNNFGYDVYGNEIDDDYDDPTTDFKDGEFFGAHKPVFASFYLQDKIEFEDIIVNAGLRYDYFDVDNKELVDPSYPDAGINPSSGEIIAKGWRDVPTFNSLSPRLGLSFPVTDKTVFHAQYGKFVQQSRLLDIYQGYYRTSYEIKGGFEITNPVGKNLRPTRTTQYELGFTQMLTDFMSVDITGYYRDVKDQVVFIDQAVAKNSAFQAYSTLANGDFATTKGLEINLNMRRFERVLLNANISFNDARGTGSFPNSNRGIVGAPLEGGAPFNPVYIAPLEYNNAVKGSFNIDYRFGANDGPSWLHEFGASILASFTSGHPYTRGKGSEDLEGDARNRSPVEALNSSTTPSTFQVDLRIDKTFAIYDNLAANIYIQVINLFDKKNVENVFLRTGSTTDDGYISDPDLGAKLVANYGERYIDLYKAVNIDYYERYQNAGATNYGGLSPSFYSAPRQIRLGIKLSY